MYIFPATDIYLTNFMPLVSFYTPWKHENISDFLGVLERDWHELGLAYNKTKNHCDALRDLYNLNNLKNARARRIIWVKLQAKA